MRRIPPPFGFCYRSEHLNPFKNFEVFNIDKKQKVEKVKQQKGD